MIHVRCGCRKSFQVDETRLTKALFCPSCRRELHIPGAVAPPGRSRARRRVPADLVQPSGGRSLFGIANLVIGSLGVASGLVAAVGGPLAIAKEPPGSLSHAGGPFLVLALAISVLGGTAAAFAMAASGVSALRCRAAETRRWSGIALALAAGVVASYGLFHVVAAMVLLSQISGRAAAIGGAIAFGVVFVAGALALAWPLAQYLIAARSLFPGPKLARRARRRSSPRLAPVGSRLATR